ncbi:MAG: molybdate ABC transporter substrate-binding protein [Candidatus Nanopelagicales bacterium]|nr:molybdate ABC transporter substrate-binding protein [Candidatus Nanopelagicales bacterium]MDP4824434.1 molybdate ABC transporter substrate-binding protein [Candidatus Nanopelagicales bacterium]MDP4888185.1 molybdate ABC transporter substrate-binding protein [Candidatus Nanopelagicales bacterium]
MAGLGRRGRIATSSVLALICVAATGSCGPAESRSELIVFAAASLTNTFSDIELAFEEVNPNVDVLMNFGPSSGLVSALRDGAPVDVIATANTITMQSAVAEKLVWEPVTFAGNRLTIAVPEDNPAAIDTMADLAEPGVLVAMCQPQVPCGIAAAQAIAASGLKIEPVTFELDVRGVLSKVILDEVDAGFVYATDVVSAGSRVREISLPVGAAEVVNYPIATVQGTTSPEVAQAFLDFVNSSLARDLLRTAGFTTPTGVTT